jgi:hypothetical protein
MDPRQIDLNRRHSWEMGELFGWFLEAILMSNPKLRELR